MSCDSALTLGKILHKMVYCEVNHFKAQIRLKSVLRFVGSPTVLYCWEFGAVLQGASFWFFLNTFHPFLHRGLYAVVNGVYISLVQAEFFLPIDGL